MCEVVLPERAPTFLGVVNWEGKTTRFTVAEGVRVKVNGKSAQKAVLKSTKEAKPSFITWNDDLRLVLHFHMDKPAIRIWDNQRPQRFSLPPSKSFPINRDFRLPAKYTRHFSARQAQSTDTFGDLVEDRMDGYIAFKYQGVQYRLGVTETADHTLFVKFRDQTSGRETYPPAAICIPSRLERVAN